MKMLINGRYADSLSGETYDVFSPASGAKIDTVPLASAKDIRLAMNYAVEAQKAWARVPLTERAEVLARFVGLVRTHMEELARTLSLDNGKTIREARAELSNLLIAVPAFIEKAKHLSDEILPIGAEARHEKNLQAVIREPAGVIVCIIPFNFPSNLFCQKVVPALLMGNAAVVLPPSGNPLTVLGLSRLMNEAGVPAGVLQTLTARGAVKEAAVLDGRAALITLTGSTETGRHIAELAAQKLIPCALELGGNDPFIVTEDADLDLAIRELKVGRLVNAGQICCASKRYLVHRSLSAEFIRRAKEFVERLQMGDPLGEETDIGSLINEKAARTVEAQVERTLKEGAQLVTGGRRDGAFYTPTVLSSVTKDMAIAGDMEVFGPVIPVIPFDTDEEAVAIANQSVYGLSAAVFSENHRRIVRIVSRLESGVVVVNGASNLRSFEMPFGGRKQSGIGTEGVASTFDEMTRKKVVILKNYL